MMGERGGCGCEASAVLWRLPVRRIPIESAACVEPPRWTWDIIRRGRSLGASSWVRTPREDIRMRRPRRALIGTMGFSAFYPRDGQAARPFGLQHLERRVLLSAAAADV